MSGALPQGAEPGRIVASFGRTYRVELAGGALLDCATRGKRSDLACGDHVSARVTGGNSGVIEAVLPRTTLLYRSDAHRQKLVAANVTQAAIVVAPVPSFHEDLINRCIAACEHAAITPLIVLNKADLPESAAAWASLAPFRALGYQVLQVCAKRDTGALLPLLHGHASVLVGQSGMGKSTLINALVPGAAQRIAEISAALDSGTHTTTGARLLHLDADSQLIDSPGMQVFGLHHLTLAETAHAFVELRPCLGQCRFRDCTHRSEPGCAVTEAAAAGRIAASRLACYRTLAEERRRADAHRYD